MATGMTTETIDGTIRFTISDVTVTLFAIHSMIVVTSPIGDHAPPLLAASTITPANIQRSFCSGSKRRIIITIIIVVVMLSSTALMKNETNAIIHISCLLFLALIRSVIKLKPP